MTTKQLECTNKARWINACKENEMRIKHNKIREKNNAMRTESERVQYVALVTEEDVRLKNTRNGIAGQLIGTKKEFTKIPELKKKVESGQVKATEDYNRLIALADKLLGDTVVK
jgi:hypothetical protein